MNRTINNLAAIISMSLALTALTAASSEAEKPIVQPKVEMVAQISQPIGNLTFTPDNRKFFSIHPFYKPQIRVAELTSPTTFKPFPNLSWNTPQKNSDLFLDDVLGIRGDENGIVWILDMGNRSKVTPWLYYGPMNGRSLYRLKIADILDDNLPDEELQSRVQRYSDKVNNGGITLDQDGNVYSTEPENAAIGIIPAKTKKYQRFTADKQCTWPDGLSYSPDGYMYVSDSQIDKSPLCNDGKALNKPPYQLFRFKPLAPGRVGQ